MISKHQGEAYNNRIEKKKKKKKRIIIITIIISMRDRLYILYIYEVKIHYKDRRE